MKPSFLLQTTSFALCLGTCVQARIYNGTIDADHIVGVYPISGQYGLLNRVLSYVLWIFVVCFEKWTWPVLGALAYLMTYSASAAVHALVLAITSINGLYDLDAAGAWAVLSVAATISAPVMWYSDRLRDSAYRPVFGFWSTVVATGCICCIAALLRDYPEEPACWSNASNNDMAILLTSPAQLLIPEAFNCSYAFFNTTQPMRSPSEMTVLPSIRAFGSLYVIWIASCILTGVFGVYIALFGCLTVGDRRRTKAELQSFLASKISKHATAKQRRMYRKSRNRARKELETGTYQRSHCWPLLLNPIVVLVVVSLNEAYLLAGRQPLPSGEPLYAVGQWGPWVTVGLALIAAVINTWYEGRWEKLKKTLDVEAEERVEERRKKAIPQIKLDVEMEPLDDGFTKVGPTVLDDVESSASTASRGSAQSVSDERHDHAESTVTRPTNVLVHDHAPPNVARIQWRLPRVRHRLEEIHYDPPFDLAPAGMDLSSICAQQHDVVCHAYDEVGKQYDGAIIRDIDGHDWIVQKGILWHRELWEWRE